MANNQNPGLYNGGRPPGPQQGSQNLHGFSQVPGSGPPNFGMRPGMDGSGSQKVNSFPPSFSQASQNQPYNVSHNSGVNGTSTPPLGQGGQPRPVQGAGIRPTMMNGPSDGPRPNTTVNQFPNRPPGPRMPPNVPQGQFRPPGSGAAVRNFGPPPPVAGAPRMGMVPPATSPQQRQTQQQGPPSSVAAERPNELPVPYHGQGQYSHQVGLLLTPGQTPMSSASPSQKSSRASSPSGLGSSQNFDALEGQFNGTPDQSGDSPAVLDTTTKPGFPPQPSNPSSSSPQQWGPTSTNQPRYQAPGPQTGPPSSTGAPIQQYPAPSMNQSGFPPQNMQNQQRFPGPPSSNNQQTAFSAASPSSNNPRPGLPPAAIQPQGFQQQSVSNTPRQGFPQPPSSQPGFPPASVANQPQGFPPTSKPTQHQGFPPPPSSMANQHQGFPPTSMPNQHQGFPLPPSSMANQHQGFPPTSMPNQHQGFPPPTSSMANQHQGFPPTSMPNQHQGFPPPPSPLVNQNQSGFAPPTSSSQQHGFDGLHFPPKANQQQGYPPNSQGVGQQGGFNTGMPGQGGYPKPGQQFNQGQNKFNAYQGGVNTLSSGVGSMAIQEGSQVINLLQQKQIIPPDGVQPPKPKLPEVYRKVNCSPDVFRCTLNAIPQTTSLLNKARLPLGILIHPFKDLSQLPVIQSSVIVRCRSCRTYINPFVQFLEQKRWKCNLCYRLNELPEEFNFDPVTKTYGDPQRRPEIKSATIEFIAPSEYMLRPPQPAVYLYVLDVSFNAMETGYLAEFCSTLLDVLDKVPGDSRTQIGFIAFDSAIHFFNLAEGLSQPQMLTVSDVDDIFLPCPDNLLVNLDESKELVIDLLTQLPLLFEGNMDTGSALGAVLQSAYKLMHSNGGRVTVMQTVLPTVGPGALQNREESNPKSSKDVPNLGPAIDFYKKLALDCSAQQMAVDLFLFNGQYADIASIECISKFSGGSVNYYPSFHVKRSPHLAEKFEVDLRRYLTRKIGFEAVMRIRCSKGLSIHTFHGNFFVRSTDLLSLPNVNPDSGFAMQMSIEENLTDLTTMCFQAALLYTSSKGERRIRVHTLCLPITNQLSEIYASADQQAIIALVAKMAVDRSISSNMSDAREGIVHAAVDSLNAFAGTLNASQKVGSVPVCESLRLMPLYCLALLKSAAFRTNIPTRLDDRVFALSQLKTMPVGVLIQQLYPNLYPIHTIMDVEEVTKGNTAVPDLPLLQLSSANIDRYGAYLLDAGTVIYLYVGSAINEKFCVDILDKPNFSTIVEGGMSELPEMDNPGSERLRNFMTYLLDSRPNGAAFIIAREDGKNRLPFFHYFVEDRSESVFSYHEFLQSIQKQLSS